MRIVIVTTWFPEPDKPSVAPFILKHAQAIARLHQLRVVHLQLARPSGRGDRTGMDEYSGLTVVRVGLDPKRPSTWFRGAAVLWREVRSAQLLHTMAFTSAVFVAPFASVCRVPWIHTEHWSGVSNPASVSKTWDRFSWLRFTLKLPKIVTAVSVNQAQEICRFARKNAIQVVPNVIDLPRRLALKPATALSNASGRELEIVSVGGLVDGKGPLLALRALAVLRQQGVDAALTWVGDGPLRADMEAGARAMNLTGYLHLTGSLPPKDVTDYLLAANVFLLPTAHETFCVAAAEAIAADLPAVVSDLPALREFLSPRNSVLVSESSPEAFAAGIMEARHRFAHHVPGSIANTLADRYASETIGAEFTALYRRITDL